MSDFTPGTEKGSLVKITSFTSTDTRDSSQASLQAETIDTAPRQFQDGDFMNWQLSGLFTIPTVDLPLTMFLYVSSQLDTTETVQIQVNRVTNSSKNTIFQTAVGVPAQGAVQVQFDAWSLGLIGQTVEVLLRSAEFLNIFQLFPSINIVQTFPADGATLPLLFVPPGNFQQIFPVNNNNTVQQQGSLSEEEPPPPILVTTGVLEVPQGVFAVRPQVELVLSSFFDEALTADVVVNRLVRGSTTKEQVLAETIAVPPFETRQRVLNDVEGLPVEINLSLSRTEEGNALQPAVNVSNLFISVQSVDLVLFIPPGQFQGIFTDSSAALHMNTGGRPITKFRNKGGL